MSTVMFKDGQTVMVKGLYGMTVDGEAVFKSVSKSHHTKGMYVIETLEDKLIMVVDPTRVMDYNDYYSQKDKLVKE